MPPIAKEPEVLRATPGTTTATLPSTSTPTESSPARPQPVALEVPVTVNGARTVEGSEKREPFSETTKTVLVFSNGAVIRLASAVTPGQLLFLTNEKTKKEVVCQVVKSKNYRNVSGYVEMEFTEPVIGFWGMRFPNDRIGPAPVAPAAKIAPPPPPPAPPKAEPPAVSITRDAVQAPPVVTKPVEPKVAEAKPAGPAPVQVSVIPPEPPAPVVPLIAKPEVPVIPIPELPAPAPITPEPAAGSTEALRLETARLQEQLSSMLFSQAPASKPPQEPPAELSAGQKTLSDVTSKIFEIAKNQPAPVMPLPLVKSAPPSPRPSMDEESVKIPAWLEPLARNTVAPASTQELIEREKARRSAEKSELSEPEVETVAITEIESLPELKLPSFGSELLTDEQTRSEDKVSRGSNKGIWIGAVAAGLILLAGGGVWYLRQQTAPVNNSVTSANAPAAAAVTANVLHSKPAVIQPTAPANNFAAAPPATATSTPAVNSQPATLRDAKPLATNTYTSAAPKSTQPVPVEEPLQLQQVPQKTKPMLGEVHLASPKVHRGASSEESGAADPGLALNTEQTAPGTDALAGNLVAGSVKQPAAPAEPLPVGGDVKPAKMISSVPPVYPALARAQHVSGDIKIDALIDANGRVTSMKVISGPTLLHQAAMDALRQWKYQPAALDGNPVPMHLTITLQFRLQR